MASKRTIEAVLRWSVDNNSLRQVSQSTENFRRTLGKTAGNIGDVETTASRLNNELAKLARQQAIDGIAQDAARATLETDDLNAVLRDTVTRLDAIGANKDEIRAVAQEMGRAADEAERLERNARGAGSVGRGRSGVNIGDEAGSAGTLFSAVGGLNALGAGGAGLQEAGQLGDIAESLTRIGPLGAASAVALGAVSVALGELQRRSEEAAKAQQLIIDAENREINREAENRDALENRTNEENIAVANEQQARFNDTLNALREAEARLAAIDAEYSDILGNSQDIGEQLRALTDLGPRGETERKNIEDLRNDLQILGEEVQNTVTVLGPQIVVRDDEREAIAAQQEAEEELTQARETARQSTENFLRSLTNFSDQVSGSDLLRNVGGALGNRLTEQFESAVGNLGNRVAANSSGMGSFVTRIINNGVNAISSGVGNLVDAGNEFFQVTNRVGDALRAIEAEEQRHTNALASIRQQLRDRENEILSSANERAAAIGEQYNVERIRAQQDLQRELRKIDRQISNAVGERDALAALYAEQQKAETKENADIETRRKREAYEQQIRDLAASTKKQLDTAREGARRAIEVENEKYRAEIQRRQLALQQAQLYYSAALNLQVQAANQEISLRNQTNNAALNGLTILRDRAIALFSGASGGSTISGAGGGGNRTGAIPTRDFGGNIAAGQIYSVNRELMAFDRKGFAFGMALSEAVMGSRGGSVLNLNINGVNEQTVDIRSRQQAINYVFEWLTDSGVKR